MSDQPVAQDRSDEEELSAADVVFAPWDGRRVPVTLVGGYLGAGKTTLINEMLARTDVPIAVMVNDVGAVNIDARLVRRHRGGTIELSGGCVCCSLKNGLLAAFDELRGRAQPPEHVVIELSGVADPSATIGLVGTPGFVLDGVVVLVDLETIVEHLDEESIRGDAVRVQVDAADVIVATKADLVSGERARSVRATLRARGVTAPIVTAASVQASAGLVGLGARQVPKALASRPTLFDQHTTSVIALADPIDRAELELIVATLPDSVVRAKGIAHLGGGELVSVQVVGERRNISALPAADFHPATDLVVISIEP